MESIVHGVLSWLDNASVRLRAIVGLGLVLGGLAIGLIAGVANQADVGAARAEGRHAGQAEARGRGSQQGYAAGLATGTKDGDAQTYRTAYDAAYRKALAQAGGG